MAAGTFTVLNRAKLKMLTGVLDLDTHPIKAALATQSWSPTADYAGTSTDARYADLGAAEVANGNGYASGGVTVTATVSRSTGTVTFTTTSPTWNAATFSAKYLVLYADNTNDDIIGYMDLETGVPAGVSPSNGTLTVNPNAGGWFTV